MNGNLSFSIGLMSGTSLDGIDLVYVKFDKNKLNDYTILEAKTVSYSNEWRNILQQSITFSSEKLVQLDIDYGKFLGEVTQEFITEFQIERIDFIASHGHTVLHQPDQGITLQIGNGQEIANYTQKKVVCDFRTQDVLLGGQGAPLVPIGDELLFSDFEYCVNLGGFANVSFKNKSNRIAFDICPVNIVLNFYAQKLGFEYDASGKIASEGAVNEELLSRLNNLPFYEKTHPKSLGLEWVKEFIFPLLESLEKDSQVILRTFVEHVAMQIGKVIYKSDSVLITGGGVFNAFLMERIIFYAKNRVEIQSEKLINYKEALIFSFLGMLRIDNQINCLSSVTGAQKNHSSGVIFNP